MSDLPSLEALLSAGEALGVEFKSDRGGLSDREIYEEVVALANTEGGTLLVGVEDDGTVTGARPRHGARTESVKLQAAIFNNTVPSINTRISRVDHPAGTVIAIAVDAYPAICATASGRCVHRVLGGDGKPATVPFFPHEQQSRQADLGLLDFSAQPAAGVTFEDLDPLAFERLRQTVARRQGDRALLELSDPDLAKALKLVETDRDRLVPNLAGLLLVGRAAALERVVPTHAVRFQVLDERLDVRVNDTLRGPLVEVLDQVEERFTARLEEREVMVGLYRVPVPDYDLDAVREAVSNAVLHRDYRQLQSIYLQWHPDHLLITEPGGFPSGVTLDNLLVHEPKPRNPRLAAAFQRIGLVEETGRGVDRIYEGQLRYGRPAPDYSRSDATGVRLVLHQQPSSLEVAALVVEHERQGRRWRVDDLLAFHALRGRRFVTEQQVAELIQKDATAAQAALTRLVDWGVAFHQAPTYGLRQVVAQRLEVPVVDHDQAAAQVLAHVRVHGRITRSQAAELTGLGSDAAKRLLASLAERHPSLRRVGEGRGTYYEWQEGTETGG